MVTEEFAQRIGPQAHDEFGKDRSTLKSLPERIIAIGSGLPGGAVHRFVTLAALFGLVFATGSIAPDLAVAQTGPLGTRSVIVDLSVLGDNGNGPPPVARGITPSGPGGVLLMPGPKPPRSQLHVAPAARRTAVSTARQAKPRPTQRANRQSPRPIPAKPARPQAPPRAASVAPLPPRVPVPPVIASNAPPPPARPALLAPQSASRSAPPPPPPAPTGGRRPSAASAPLPPPPMPAAPPTPQKSAALTVPPPTTTAAPTSGQPLSVLFAGDSTKVGEKWHTQLAGFAKQLETNSEMRLQLLAYAGGASLSASRARRLSLSRALAVRQYLIKAGVRSTRIDVRALSDKAKNDPKNRVDVTVVGR